MAWLDDERVKKTGAYKQAGIARFRRVVGFSLDEIKELIELVSQKQFTEFELVRGDFRLRLSAVRGWEA
jgi:DNA-binding transcriptional MerR regulator